MARVLGIVLVVGVVGLVGQPAPAHACGGFFCGQQPVDQQAERIVFAVNDDGTVTMIVQIAYRGAADDFAWILPLASVPDRASLGTFPQRALMGLDARTGPQFQWPSDCDSWLRYDAAAGGPPSADDGGVTVHIRETVGPYDVAVIESDDPEALVTWLRTNEYRVTDVMRPYIALYASEGMKFLALKLTTAADVTDIAPFRMTLNGSTPSIPIRLTALAAEPEMGIAVFILGDMRYGGANWPELEIRDDQIVWNPYSYSWPIETNWTALVARAADDAGGRGWVTEYAGSTAEYVDLLRSSTPADEETRIATEELLALMEPHPYLTRLYTRLSPEEMTTDPVFRRTGGADVSNARMLPRYVEGERDLCYYDPATGGSTPPTDVTTPCDFAACGAGGLCRVVPGATDGDPDVAGCACIPGTTARTTFDPAGRATVVCQDMRMSFVNPGDREVPGGPVLPDPCAGFDCGSHGNCVAMNMTPTCQCRQGYVAIGSVDTAGARFTTCVEPPVPVPDEFYFRRLASRPAELPAGRIVEIPGVEPRGGGVCAAAGDMRSAGGLALALAAGAIILVSRARRRR